MKSIKIFQFARYLILAVFFIVLCSFFQDSQVLSEPIKLSWKLIVALILGLYDVIARIIPTINDWSWLSWIIKLVSFLNEFLNRKRK